MIAWFARNDVAANLLMISIIIAGFFAVMNISVRTFPEVSPDQVQVTVALRGATPEDVELGVAVRIEEAVQDLEGIDTVTSRSVEGSTTVIISVEQNYNPREMLNDIKSRVDAINTFPADAEKPNISLRQRKFEVLKVAIYGDQSELELRRYAEQVRDEILRIPEITLVELSAARNYEINIEVAQDQLRELNLSLADVAQAVRASSLDASAGNIRTQGGNVLIRSKGQAYWKKDFEEIAIKSNADGSIIRLGEVATVRDDFEEESLKNIFNGKNAVMLDVYRTGKQSAIQIAEKTRAYITEKSKKLPVGMRIDHWDDDSEYLKSRLSTLLQSAAQGGIFVIVLLALFLRPAIAFWVVLGIPVSFLGGLYTLWLFDIPIDIMSLFGFIVVLGIVVDDAIVTGENVYTRLKTGEDGLQAAIEGTRQVAIPVTFGILTTVAAFVPLMVLEGNFRRFFMPIGAVVIPVLLFSLIESKLVLPAHLKSIKMNRGDDISRISKWQRSFAQGFEDMIVRYYRPVLRACLRHRHSVLMLFIAIFIVSVSALRSGWIDFIFFPKVESESVRVTLTMPVGTPFEVTDKHMQTIVNAALDLQQEYRNGDGPDANPLILKIWATTGSAGSRGASSNLGRVIMETVPADTRISSVSPRDLSREWRKRVGNLAGVESISFRAESFRPGDPINIQLSAGSFELLSNVGEKVKERLRTYPTVFDITDSLSDGKEEIRIELRSQGYVLGLSRSEILQQLGRAFRGFEAQRIQRGRDEVRVLVRLPREERSSISTLNEFLVTTPDGRQVPLSQVATLRAGVGPAQITRIDNYRTLNVTADLNKEKTNMTALTSDIETYMQELLASNPGVTYRLEGENREQRLLFGSLKTATVVLMFAIYCLLALPLRSYSQPILVMSIIPLGLVGALLGHAIMGMSLTILSVFGLLALTGVIINDSLVLVDYVNQQRAKGTDVVRAALTAGVNRFRPVFLTSVTTFFGLVPVMFNDSTQAQFLKPMAVSLGWGIIFATAITLVAIPVNILIAEDIRRVFRALRSKTERDGMRWLDVPNNI